MVIAWPSGPRTVLSWQPNAAKISRQDAITAKFLMPLPFLLNVEQRFPG
jgi:hypothetical protein